MFEVLNVWMFVPVDSWPESKQDAAQLGEETKKLLCICYVL
jgi:hypothetical protein